MQRGLSYLEGVLVTLLMVVGFYNGTYYPLLTYLTLSFILNITYKLLKNDNQRTSI